MEKGNKKKGRRERQERGQGRVGGKGRTREFEAKQAKKKGERMTSCLSGYERGGQREAGCRSRKDTDMRLPALWTVAERGLRSLKKNARPLSFVAKRR